MLKNPEKKIIGATIIFTVAAIVVLIARRSSQPESPALASFAQCLAAKGATMYGADWCPHCQKEKGRFGAAFRYVPYVECPREPNRCRAQNVTGYPTWIFPDGYSPTGSPVKGKRLEGEQGLKRLSEASGCPLEENPAGEVQ